MPDESITQPVELRIVRLPNIVLVGEKHIRRVDDIDLDADFLDSIDDTDVLLLEARPSVPFNLPAFTELGNYHFNQGGKPVVYMKEVLEEMGISTISDCFRDSKFIEDTDKLKLIRILDEVGICYLQKDTVTEAEAEFNSIHSTNILTGKLFEMLRESRKATTILVAVQGIMDFYKLYRDFKYAGIINATLEKYRSVAVVVGLDHLEELQLLLQGNGDELSQELKTLASIVDIRISTVMDMLDKDTIQALSMDWL